MPSASPAERGSVLIYIFIAIVVLAALTFAVSNSNREGVATVDRERSDLQATQILDYTGMIRRVVQTMKVDGIPVTDICFHSPRWGYAGYNHTPACDDPRNQVFLPTGGGASFQDPGDGLLNPSFGSQPRWGDFLFTGANRVTGVGSDCINGTCNELLLVLPYLRREVCLALNKRLQVVTAPDTIPQDDADFDTTLFAGTFPAGQAINVAALEGKRTGCFEADNTPASGAYIFFAVLSAQ